MSLPDPPPEYHAEMESLREQLQAVQEDHEATADRLRERRDENAALKEQLEAFQQEDENLRAAVPIYEKPRSTQEQLEAYRVALQRIARNDQTETGAVAREALVSTPASDSWPGATAFYRPVSSPAKKPCAYHAPLYVEGCRDCAAQNQEPDPASEPEAGNMGGVLHQERADHLRRAAQNQESKP